MKPTASGRTMTVPPEVPYGGRFFDELRRLTNSTQGFKYEDIPGVRAMDREQILGALSQMHKPDWILRLDSSSPEDFARAIVREGQARAVEREEWGGAVGLLVDLASILLAQSRVSESFIGAWLVATNV